MKAHNKSSINARLFSLTNLKEAQMPLAASFWLPEQSARLLQKASLHLAECFPPSCRILSFSLQAWYGIRPYLNIEGKKEGRKEKKEKEGKGVKDRGKEREKKEVKRGRGKEEFFHHIEKSIVETILLNNN